MISSLHSRPRRSAAALLALALGCGFENERDVQTERTQGDTYDEQTSAHVRASEADGVAVGLSKSEVRFVRNLTNFQGPESVKYDAEQDVYFITNMTGPGSAADGNGYISRVSAGNPDSTSIFAQGGKNGVVLDSPKGTALHGDTLWVADIHSLRAFDRHTGAPLANVDLSAQGAVQLNDVAIGPDGTIRVTDTGIIMSPKGVMHPGPDRVYSVGPNRTVSIVSSEPAVTWPNGISWDAGRKRWIIVSFDPFVGRIYSTAPDGSDVKVIRQRPGSGRLDGVEVLPDGDILFTSWADSSLHLLHGDTDRKLVREVPEAADIGLDTKRGVVAIPLSVLGRVQLWTLPGLGAMTSTATAAR